MFWLCVCACVLLIFESLKVGPFKEGLPFIMLSSYRRAMFLLFYVLLYTSTQTLFSTSAQCLHKERTASVGIWVTCFRVGHVVWRLAP